MPIPKQTPCLIFCVLLAAVSSCKPAGSSSSTSPPPSARRAEEGELNTVFLAESEEERLGIRTEAVEERELSRVRMLGGEVTIPPGRSVTIAAPFQGTLRAVSSTGGSAEERDGLSSPALGAGRAVARGEVLLAIEPILSADSRASLVASRVEAEGAAKAAQVERDAAEISLRRARQLLEDRAGSQRSLDEAMARVQLAEETRRAAVARRDLLEAVIAGAAGAGSSTVLPLASPIDGMITQLLVAPGQVVAAGTPLFEISTLDRLWVRVRVFAGDAGEVDASAPVRVGPLGAPPGGVTRVADPVEAPPAADPAAATVDFVYQLEGEVSEFRPGQKVTVALALRSEGRSLVVPWAGVLHDALGGTWVYVAAAPGRYVRRRVQIRHVVDGYASVVSGPDPGARVVTAGAAELFGKEFGIGK